MLLTALVNKEGAPYSTAQLAANTVEPKSNLKVANLQTVSYSGTTYNGTLTIDGISDADIAKVILGANLAGTGVGAAAKVGSIRYVTGNNVIVATVVSTASATVGITQTVSEVQLTTSPPQTLIVSETLAAIDTFTS